MWEVMETNLSLSSDFFVLVFALRVMTVTSVRQGLWGEVMSLSVFAFLFVVVFWVVTMTRTREGVGSDGDLGRKNPTEDFPDVVKVAATEEEDHDRHYCEQEKLYVVQS